MVRLAREGWPRWIGTPGRCLTTRVALSSARVLDEIAKDHPAADGLLDFCRNELQHKSKAFCRERERDRSGRGTARHPLDAGIPAGRSPVRCSTRRGRSTRGRRPSSRSRRSPTSGRPISGRVVPPRDEREAARAPDDPRGGARATTSKACTRTASTRSPRSVFGSGLFAEGGSTYVTQVMMDLGYRADDPGVLLNHWKYYLRAVVNAIIDARIHTASMTEEEAVSLMVDGAFQEEAEARAKYEPGTPVVDPAVDLLHGLARVLVHRARGPGASRGRRRLGSPRFWSRRGARASGGRRVRGHARVRHTGAHLEAIIAHGTPPTSTPPAHPARVTSTATSSIASSRAGRRGTPSRGPRRYLCGPSPVRLLTSTSSPTSPQPAWIGTTQSSGLPSTTPTWSTIWFDLGDRAFGGLIHRTEVVKADLNS